MSKQTWVALSAGWLAVIVAAAVLGSAYRVQLADAPALRMRPIVTVDAGHGGFDGGAVAPDGTAEKDLNLAIATSLRDVLILCGFDTVMTRVDDTALCEQEGLAIRDKKVADMKARLTLYEQADINISIHQNSFSQAQYHGTQVFYSANHEASEMLAERVREQVVAYWQPDNTRRLKSGNRDIYLLHKTTRPTVLVECGFLSNEEELAQLKTAAYQHKMAFAVAGGVLRFAAEYEREAVV